MRCSSIVMTVVVVVVVVVTASQISADESTPSNEAVRIAIAKSIPLLEQGSQGSAENRKCFTCHNQALPVLTLVEARKYGFSIDEKNLTRQLDHTAAHLSRGLKAFQEGRGQGGKVISAGYALWTLEAGERKANDITAAVTDFLLEYQKDETHWSHPGKRPPSSGSDFTSTYVALRGLSAFGSKQRQSKIEARHNTIKQWLVSENPTDTESRVFRLRALAHLGVEQQEIQQAAKELIVAQRDDGGWSQTADMKSDAYATATVLVALLHTEELSRDTPVVLRGIHYLLNNQLDDGSWHVVSRAEPFQTYFETGYPHEKDQFISITASSWATLALLLTLPNSP